MANLKHNPAVSGTQYRLAQAVLSGTVREGSMDVRTAREIVDGTPHELRQKWSHGHPDKKANLFGFGKSKTTFSSKLSKQVYDAGYRGDHGHRGDSHFNAWVATHKVERQLIPSLRKEYWKGVDQEEKDASNKTHRTPPPIPQGAPRLGKASAKKESKRDEIKVRREALALKKLEREEARMRQPPPLPKSAKESKGGYGAYYDKLSPAMQAQARAAMAKNPSDSVEHAFGHQSGERDKDLGHPKKSTIDLKEVFDTVFRGTADFAKYVEGYGQGFAGGRSKYHKGNPSRVDHHAKGSKDVAKLPKRAREYPTSYDNEIRAVARKYADKFSEKHPDESNTDVYSEYYNGLQDALFSHTSHAYAVYEFRGDGQYQNSEPKSPLFKSTTQARKWLETDLTEDEHFYGGKEGRGFVVRRVVGGQAANRHGNPSASAASLFEMFHGKPSTQVTEVQEQLHYHANLAELGVLSGLKVRTPTGFDVTLEFAVPEVGEGAQANPQKWLLPKKRGKKNYEDVGYLPFALQHDVGFSGAKRYHPVKVSADGGFTVASSELHSVEYDPYSRTSAIAAIKELYSRQEKNPKGKGKSPGPLSSAYRFGKSIVPGVLEGVDKLVMGNPHGYQVRFIKPDQSAELMNLYHLARVPLSGTGKDTPYERMLWASKEFAKLHPEVSSTGAYKDLDGLRTNWFGGEPSRGRKRNASAPSGPVILCSNESGNQIYLRAGDQSIPSSTIAKVHMATAVRDLMNFGEIWAIAYITRKSFDDFQRIEYVHGFGPEKYHYRLSQRADMWDDAKPPKPNVFGTGQLPTLMYDNMNQAIQFAGGVYEIKPDHGAGSIFN